MIRAALVLAVLLAAFAAHAVEPGERLQDPALEQRAREISKTVRCLVCQNQSIDDSNAELARDLRRIVRERISAGDSDHDVLRYLTDRYGAFVLLKPPLMASTAVLWFGPVLIGSLAVIGYVLFLRSRRGAAGGSPAPLTADERARLDAMLKAREAP